VLVYFFAPNPGRFVAGAVFCSILLVMFVIDLEHMVLPDKVNAAGVVLGLCIAGLGWTELTLVEAILGALAGYGIIAFVVWASKGGMGMGDAKFLGMIGSFLGPWGALGTLFGASLIGTIVGVSLMVLKRHIRGNPISFGPFLAFAASL